MKNSSILLLLFCFFSMPVFSQKKEEKAIKLTINNFFKGLNTGDTALIRSTCTATPVFQTFMADEKGELKIHSEDFEEFLNFLGTPSKMKLEEKIEFENISIEPQMASVWTPYTFWLNGKVNHVGTNSFQLVKEKGGWRIQYILDTRRKQ